MRIRIAFGLIAIVLGSAASADDMAAAMRAIVTKNGDALLHVKLSVKQTYSIPEYGTEVEEFTEEIVATVISPEGLMVTSLMNTDPAAWMEDMYDGDDGYSSKTELTSLKVLRGGEEEDAEIVLRDRDLDLAFIRPLKKPEAPWSFVDLSVPVKAAAFDPIIAMGRLGKVAQRAATADTQRIAAVQDRPRLTYILGAYTGNGIPIFITTGECLGINVTRMLRSSGQNGMGLSDDYGMNMASVVVPGPDVMEIAKQVPAYAD